jgi:hypothetical protein
MVARALEVIKPDAVLIEGPPDAASVLHHAASGSMVPPVALLVYDPDAPHDAAFYPFAEFSPEWQAMRWALKSGVDLRFIDLPQSLRPAREPHESGNAGANGAPTPPTSSDQDEDVDEGDDDGGGVGDGEPREGHHDPREDPLEALAHAAGFVDGEAWWGRLIEERHGEDNPLDVFAAISEAMASAREQLGPRQDPLEPAREAHMRRSIRAAVKDGRSRIAVICGAWHAPVLSAAAIKAIPAKSDDAILKPLAKRKTACTWIPWTYDRLALSSGYGAGVISPGWYEHIWQHQEHVATRWLTKVARFMRDEGLEAPPASVIESVRLAESLAAIRERAVTGLDELNESTLSILCHGDPLPLRVIEQKLIVGVRLGEIPDDSPALPLQQDLAAQQKTLRLKVSGVEATLDLDLRKDFDLARSHLLHRLNILDIPWASAGVAQTRSTGTFREVWKLQWKPEFAINIVTAARYGNTIADAASACVRDRAAKATDLADLTSLLDDVMLADLHGAVEALMARIQEISAVAATISSLLHALPPLGRILRYGNVRKTDAALVEPLMESLLARICVGLIPACASLDDDAAADIAGHLKAVATTLKTLGRDEFSTPWRVELHRFAESSAHPLIKGWACRVLLDEDAIDAEIAATYLSLALSPGNDPSGASSWLEGFLSGSGAILVHDASLLALIDQWISGLPNAIFQQVCPIVRRTFSTFAKPERRMIGERVKHGTDVVAGASGTLADDRYNPERGHLVDPVLALILGEPLP